LALGRLLHVFSHARVTEREIAMPPATMRFGIADVR
jgi:hypothetical protein